MGVEAGRHMKSLEQCLRTLLQTVGGDGNLLFNVGPMPDGRIEPRQVERLAEMGAWLERTAAASTAPAAAPTSRASGAYAPPRMGRCTSTFSKAWTRARFS
jgi:alpha-L-fucosidase